MLDPSIITNGALNAQVQQQQNMKMLGDTSDAFQKLLLSRKIHEMNQLSTDDEQKAYALKSKLFAPLLMQNYSENRQAKAKAIKDRLLTDAALGKTYAETTDLLSGAKKKDSEAGKINTESTGLNIDQDVKLNSMIWGSVLNGGKNAGIAQLEMQKSRGLIDEATYNQRLGFINNLPEDQDQAQKYAMAMYKGMQDPKYNIVTSDNQLDNNTSLANNQLDNTTSSNNNIRTNQTQVQTTGMNNASSQAVANIGATSAANVANINGTFANQRTADVIEYKRQQDAIQGKQGEYKSYNGKVYFVDKSGTVFDAKDAQGNQILDNTTATGSNGGVTGGGKPMPASTLNLISTSRDKIQSSQNTIDKINQSIKDLDPKQGGKLSLGLFGNAGNTVRNLTGNSNEGSMAYERLSSNIKGMVNEVLQMSKGTQTEGDAQRAANVILSMPLTDNNAVSNAMMGLKKIAQKTVALEQDKVEEYYANYGKEPPAHQADTTTPARQTGKAKPPLAAYEL